MMSNYWATNTNFMLNCRYRTRDGEQEAIFLGKSTQGCRLIFEVMFNDGPRLVYRGPEGELNVDGTPDDKDIII